MNAKTPRDHLDNYTRARIQMELTEMCIDLLDRVGTSTAQACIKKLKRQQQLTLPRIDSAAAKLGAPYPESE